MAKRKRREFPPGEEDCFYVRTPPGCDGCGLNNPLMVILKDRVWKKASKGKPDDVLCFDCIERNLGRQIVFGDLKASGCTHEMQLGAYIAQRENLKIYRSDIPLNFDGDMPVRPMDVMLKSLGLDKGFF
jgi:hypothetical protein